MLLPFAPNPTPAQTPWGTASILLTCGPTWCNPTDTQANHFYDIIENEMGWSNLLLRKQLFKAFDLDGHGDINFTEFCEGYSAMLRGTVPELLDFAWRAGPRPQHHPYLDSDTSPVFATETAQRIPQRVFALS